MKSIKFVFFKTVAILLLTFSAIHCYSQPSSETHLRSEAANKVQFVAIDGDYLIFDLRFSELPVKGCTLQILDDSGTPIFEESISGTSFSRRYKVVKGPMSRISFKASGKGFSFNQSFKIKLEEKLVIIAE